MIGSARLLCNAWQRPVNCVKICSGIRWHQLAANLETTTVGHRIGKRAVEDDANSSPVRRYLLHFDARPTQYIFLLAPSALSLLHTYPHLLWYSFKTCCCSSSYFLKVNREEFTGYGSKKKKRIYRVCIN